MPSEFNYRDILRYYRKNTMQFSDFVELLMAEPERVLVTSSQLIYSAIKHFGFEIVVRSGEPVVSYRIFKDLFAGGINAVFGQEFCIKNIVEVIESVGKESGPNRGLVLVGPPASGKTNIVDLISLALEEYTKEKNVRLYTFYFLFKDDNGREVELRTNFIHNPVLLFPTLLNREEGITHPRQQLFEHIASRQPEGAHFIIPTFYQNATLDKRSFDIIESLLHNPRNAGKSLFDIIEEYVRVEEIEFSNAQAQGIANIDDMHQLRTSIRPIEVGREALEILAGHLSTNHIYQYTGAIISSNRGLLHIHDAFGGGNGPTTETEYKPLLMLLGSGKVSAEATQTPIDNTVIVTTNIDEMELLENQLTSSKLMDRIQKVPVNYLLDTNSEMDILKRDMSIMREKYDVDPNLLRIASYYSVLTRLRPPLRSQFPPQWSVEKISLYRSITPEQKLFIFSYQSEDPVNTIRRLPHWHPFRNEALRLGLDITDTSELHDHLVRHPNATSLEESGLFSRDQLKLIDDEFMRELWNEHYPHEGQTGISIRQLQNVMRSTIAASDGRKVHVGTFFSILRKMLAEGPSLHHWMVEHPHPDDGGHRLPRRVIAGELFEEGDGAYGDYKGLLDVVRALYYNIIAREITVALVDRDPDQIEADLRKYIQHCLLALANDNRAFAHIMVPRFTFIDPGTGMKVDRPDTNYMASVEKVLANTEGAVAFRRKVAEKFLDLQNSGELRIAQNKSAVTSKDDNLLTCYAREYTTMLSHRKSAGDINISELEEAFYQKRNAPSKYHNYPATIRNMVESVLDNMVTRYGYSRKVALDTVVFALRKDIIKFAKIIS
ncbi:MAG: hypothetical protein KDC10_07375 [Calditrichaeota bacterium]|nr:hypothetical protein [Candidatus Cloacimonadota bacterium]MCB1047010.1 hypothetical protein [Calditrichota bacterium]